IIGDMAETMALVLPRTESPSDKPLHLWMADLYGMSDTTEAKKKEFITNAWSVLDTPSIWVFNKLLTGGFRIGVTKSLMTQALAIATGQEPTTIAFHLEGDWTPLNITWSELLDFDNQSSDISKPYPFYLSYPLPEGDIAGINAQEWIAEYKWDGIRGQLIHRNNQVFLWSRGEELITEQFPEFDALSELKKEFVIDGEIVAWANDLPMDFQKLQSRINRKEPGKKILHDIPARFIAYDIMEYDGKDIRKLPFEERRKMLESLHTALPNETIHLSEILPFSDIHQLQSYRDDSRSLHAEGLMLKRKSGYYHEGRTSGDMWKWKSDPYTIDAVMIYAQRGQGRSANLFSDFTFALWEGDQLIPFAKANEGLTDVEMAEITAFVISNTIEKFGPVSSVRPELVFELAFEGIATSKRHKSGVTVRYPRIIRWRRDKLATDADTLEGLKNLLSTE
ncbi:MAG: ATP-dependent DNA ligase, partial [Saprospiraceae bacterium]